MSDESEKEIEILRTESNIKYALYDEIKESYYQGFRVEDTEHIGEMFDDYDTARKEWLGLMLHDIERFDIVRVTSTLQAEVLQWYHET